MSEREINAGQTAAESLVWLAELAKLGLGETELTEMEQDMRSIMPLMDAVKELDAAPMPRPESITLGDLRDDQVRPSLSRDLLMEQHPDWPGRNKDGTGNPETFFTIPKVV